MIRESMLQDCSPQMTFLAQMKCHKHCVRGQMCWKATSSNSGSTSSCPVTRQWPGRARAWPGPASGADNAVGAHVANCRPPRRRSSKTADWGEVVCTLSGAGGVSFCDVVSCDGVRARQIGQVSALASGGARARVRRLPRSPLMFGW